MCNASGVSEGCNRRAVVVRWAARNYSRRLVLNLKRGEHGRSTGRIQSPVEDLSNVRPKFLLEDGRWIPCELGPSEEDREVPPDRHEARTLCLTCLNPESFEGAIRKPKSDGS